MGQQDPASRGPKELSMNEAARFACSFCGQEISRSDRAVELAVRNLWSKPSEDRTAQALYVHVACLTPLVHQHAMFDPDLWPSGGDS
jgi:hypothetical protein